MNDRDILAMRRQLLVAKVRLQRLQLAQDFDDAVAQCRPLPLMAAAWRMLTDRPMRWLPSVVAATAMRRSPIQQFAALAWLTWRVASRAKHIVATRAASGGN